MALFSKTSYRLGRTPHNADQYHYEDDSDCSEDESYALDYPGPGRFDASAPNNDFGVKRIFLLVILFLFFALLAAQTMRAGSLADHFGSAKEGLREAARSLEDRLVSFQSYCFQGAQVNPEVPTANSATATSDTAEAPSETPLVILPVPVEPSQAPGFSVSPPVISRPDQRVRVPDKALVSLDDRIDAALVRHSTNSPPPLGRDFALNTEYLHALTSSSGSTLDNRRQRGINGINWATGFDVGRNLGHTPNAALTDGRDDQQSCWAFVGSKGYLGIRLQERIHVESFSIEHFPRNKLPGNVVLEAPRKVVLWGLAEGPDNLSKARLYLQDGPTSRVFSQSTFILNAGEGETYVPLGTFEYKLSGTPGSHVQTKKVSQSLQSFQMDFQVVVLEVISNWGAASTCLYRAQVHGNIPQALALYASPV